jgi:hypothetical protein
MRRWLILAMLNRIFGRSPEQVLTNLHRIITGQAPGTDFPADTMNAELNRMRFAIDMNEINIRAFLDSTYRVDFLKMVLLYDDNFWDGVPTQQDHIFPKSLFEPANPAFAALPAEKQTLFKALSNRVANLELLLDFCTLTTDTPSRRISSHLAAFRQLGATPMLPALSGWKAGRPPLAHWLTQTAQTARRSGFMTWRKVWSWDSPASINTPRFHRLCAWVTRRQKAALPSSSSLSSR